MFRLLSNFPLGASMPRLLGFIIAIVCAIATTFFAVSAEARRVAFVVGNADYKNLAPLKNPQRDAATVADRLKDLGFEVTELFNTDAFSLNRSAANFVTRASGADLALFYFAGHGVQLFDRNFLLARDTDPKSVSRPQDLGLDLSSFIEALRNSGAVRLVLLIDACRDNPLSFEETVHVLDRLRADPAFKSASTTGGRGTRGLARVDLGNTGQVAKSSAQTLLFFAAQPGAVSFDGAGLNSYYVEGLKEQLAIPNRRFTEILRGVSGYVRTVTTNQQVPQIVSDWTDDVTMGANASAAKIAYHVTSNAGRTLTDAERDLVIRVSTANIFSGDFIAKASMGSNVGVGEENKRAKELGFLSGISISYDLDRDGRGETLHVSHGQVGLVFALEVDGIRAHFRNCGYMEAQSAEIALRDINGDRRPEVWIAYSEQDQLAWGKFCILEYKGIPDLSKIRRGNAGSSYGSVFAPNDTFRTLLRGESGWDVAVAIDHGIKVCAGSGCHTSWVYSFDGQWFRFLFNQEEHTKPPHSLPFRDEEERAKNLASYGVKGTTTLASPVGPQDDIRTHVARFISEQYFQLSAAEIGRIVAPTIDSYGKLRTREEVVREKMSYYAKWPDRTYTLMPETLIVNAAASQPGRWQVEFQYTFRVSNQKRRISGRGVARLGLAPAPGGRFLIVSESGEVLERY
jgi:uncharacterized caspase-like protein